ncbi:MAG: hypothetical protein AAF802_02165 [Planctomycetota bacterium]
MACTLLAALPRTLTTKCHAQELAESVVVVPATPPTPALRYRFWPSASESKSISAMPMFTRACFLMDLGDSPESEKELNDVFALLKSGEWSAEVRERAMAVLLNHQPVQKELERATNCMGVSFDLNLQQEDLLSRVSLLLPEVQKSRQLARLLIIRGHLEARDGKWQKFSRTVTSLFRLAEMVGHENSFLVGPLVRYATVSATLELVEASSQIKECPNFYWALSTVPDQLLDVRDALHRERDNPLIVFGNEPLPDEPIGAVAAAAQLRKSINTLQNAGKYVGGGVDIDSQAALLIGGLYVAGSASGCREILGDDPLWSQRVDELSDAEAVLRANRMECRRLVDRFFRWALLPTAIRGPYLSKAESQLDVPLGESPVIPAKLAVKLLLPALQAVFRAEHRMRNQLIDQVNLQAIRAGAEGESLPADSSKMELPFWPSFGDRSENVYQRVSAQEAIWSRVDQRNPGKFKQVKVVLQ